MKSNNGHTPFIIAIIVVIAGLYWYFFMGSDTQLPLTLGNPENPVQTKFQMLVSELTPISFNTSIFADPRFNALIDLSTTVSPEASGRLDPFAPIPGMVSGN
jgi:hypothetical protein